MRLGSLDDLMARDSRREEDGFPRKIRIGKLVKHVTRDEPQATPEHH